MVYSTGQYSLTAVQFWVDCTVGESTEGWGPVGDGMIAAAVRCGGREEDVEMTLSWSACSLSWT